MLIPVRAVAGVQVSWSGITVILSVTDQPAFVTVPYRRHLGFFSCPKFLPYCDLLLTPLHVILMGCQSRGTLRGVNIQPMLTNKTAFLLWPVCLGMSMWPTSGHSESFAGIVTWARRERVKLSLPSPPEFEERPKGLHMTKSFLSFRSDMKYHLLWQLKPK